MRANRTPPWRRVLPAATGLAAATALVILGVIAGAVVLTLLEPQRLLGSALAPAVIAPPLWLAHRILVGLERLGRRGGADPVAWIDRKPSGRFRLERPGRGGAGDRAARRREPMWDRWLDG